MASRKEEKERLRAERIAAEQSAGSSAKRRLWAGYAIAGLLAAAVVAGLIAVIMSGGGDGEEAKDTPANAHVQLESGTVPENVELDGREGTPPAAIKVGDLQQAAKAAGCQLMLDQPDEGNKHLKAEDPTPKYKTDPPNSGDHITVPLQTADGAYLGTLDPKYPLHALEHGRVSIQYKPTLPEDQQLVLKGVFDEDPDGMLLFQNDTMPYEVAVAAWTQLMVCPKYSPAVVDAIRDFRDTYRGNGPEQVPISL